MIARGESGALTYYSDQALENGVTPAELSETITQLAYYAGWGRAKGAHAAGVLRRVALRLLRPASGEGRHREARAMRGIDLTSRRDILRAGTVALAGTVGCASPQKPPRTATEGMLIRLSEIEVEASWLSEYLPILREEAVASVRLEPGVIAIFPMQQQESPTQIRVLEVYATRAAYEAHLQTPHFKHYKTATLQMVKALRLMDMTAVDLLAMSPIFRKVGVGVGE
jgi:quinol monooxygenase YgiN